ncbi:hypothetical protein KC19_1G058500 [Ceratodon purpureus]|uniref:Uncharacterized protein n=1 Tax=Ceratodon purpureus TaxID=3225 RepID=A0A8T0J407_CERPU|nr:hypothetical protein KC19_1G058500 [Ceratodon purpureus]
MYNHNFVPSLPRVISGTSLLQVRNVMIFLHNDHVFWKQLLLQQQERRQLWSRWVAVLILQ